MAAAQKAARIELPEPAKVAASVAGEPRLDIGITVGRHGDRDFEVAVVWRDPESGQLKWETSRVGKNGALGQAERLVRALEDFVIWNRLPKAADHE